MRRFLPICAILGVIAATVVFLWGDGPVRVLLGVCLSAMTAAALVLGATRYVRRTRGWQEENRAQLKRVMSQVKRARYEYKELSRDLARHDARAAEIAAETRTARISDEALNSSIANALSELSVNRSQDGAFRDTTGTPSGDPGPDAPSANQLAEMLSALRDRLNETEEKDADLRIGLRTLARQVDGLVRTGSESLLRIRQLANRLDQVERALDKRMSITSLQAIAQALDAWGDNSQVREVTALVKALQSELADVRKGLGDMSALVESNRSSAHQEIVEAVAHFGSEADRRHEQAFHDLRFQAGVVSGWLEREMGALRHELQSISDFVSGALTSTQPVKQEASERLAALEKSVNSISDSAREQTATLLRKGVEGVRSRLMRLEGAVDALPADVVTLQSLHSIVDPEGTSVPPSGGWAASARTISGLLELILHKDHVATIFETGSGSSTIWAALACRARGKGHVYAVEHLPEYADATRQELEARSLTEWATVVDAPLIETGDGTEQPWYDLAVLPDIPAIDVVLIDGPPARTATNARMPALRSLRNRIAETSAWILDDAVRADERAIFGSWQGDPPPGLTIRTVKWLPRAVIFEVTRDLAALAEDAESMPRSEKGDEKR